MNHRSIEVRHKRKDAQKREVGNNGHETKYESSHSQRNLHFRVRHRRARDGRDSQPIADDDGSVDIKDMSTSQRQRYFETEKENRVKQLGKHQSRKLIGQVRMLVVALNYEGTDAPLTCIIDAKRITEAAQKAGVSDITSLYDNGETKGFPSHEDVSQAIMDVGGRCGPGDYFVFYYSGHGGSQPDEEAPTGLRCTLNLRTRDGGSEEYMWDHELASLVSGHLHEETKVLMMCDACHSGGIMDVDSSGVWGKRKVAVISGCMENQLSEDSGDGGVMTNALLKVIRRKSVNQLRMHRGCSVQYVFNRVVGEMPEQEEEEEEEEERRQPHAVKAFCKSLKKA